MLRHLLLILPLVLAACQAPVRESAPVPAVPLAGLAHEQAVAAVGATCVPPLSWRAELLEQSDRHAHKLWVSPSGRTAYGVIHFSLPLPLRAEMVLPFFLREMRRAEGEAVLLHRQRDPSLPGVRFVAEGGLYKIRTNLLVRGRRGWAIYAGTLRGEEIVTDELDLAERAREHTVIGLPANGLAGGPAD